MSRNWPASTEPYAIFFFHGNRDRFPSLLVASRPKTQGGSHLRKPESSRVCFAQETLEPTTATTLRAACPERVQKGGL